MKNYYIPNSIDQYYIYDVFHNDNNELVIIMAAELPPLQIEYIDNNDNRIPFKVNVCPHNHTYIYVLPVQFQETVKLCIDENIIETHVSKYPDYTNKIIFSTIVKDEDPYIKQWIDFHYKLGINRFVIYDNSENNSLGDVLEDYISKNIVILIKWPYQYLYQKSGFSGQTTQQNHSIYAFQNSKFIGLFDVDEYINIQQPIKINDFFENLITERSIDVNTISNFTLFNKFFYNPNNLPTDGANLLNIFTCDHISEYWHEKCFVIPKNVKTFSIHLVTDGLPMYKVDKNLIYFNHYCFLNKTDRGRNHTELIDNSILIHL